MKEDGFMPGWFMRLAAWSRRANGETQAAAQQKCDALQAARPAFAAALRTLEAELQTAPSPISGRHPSPFSSRLAVASEDRGRAAGTPLAARAMAGAATSAAAAGGSTDRPPPLTPPSRSVRRDAWQLAGAGWLQLGVAQGRQCRSKCMAQHAPAACQRGARKSALVPSSSLPRLGSLMRSLRARLSPCSAGGGAAAQRGGPARAAARRGAEQQRGGYAAVGGLRLLPAHRLAGRCARPGWPLGWL